MIFCFSQLSTPQIIAVISYRTVRGFIKCGGGGGNTAPPLLLWSHKVKKYIKRIWYSVHKVPTGTYWTFLSRLYLSLLSYYKYHLIEYFPRGKAGFSSTHLQIFGSGSAFTCPPPPPDPHSNTYNYPKNWKQSSWNQLNIAFFDFFKRKIHL